MDGKMENNLYKEMQYKFQGFKLVSLLIAVLCMLTCLLLGIGTYILVAGMQGSTEVHPAEDAITVIENIIEPIEFKHPKMISTVVKKDLKVPAIEVAIPAIIGETNTVFTDSETVDESRDTIPLVVAADSFMEKPRDEFVNDEFLTEIYRLFNDYNSESEDIDSIPRRARRSVNLGLGYLPFLSYGSFGKFLYNKLTQIVQEKMQARSIQGRKFYGDSEAQFLDGHYYKRKSTVDIETTNVGEPTKSESTNDIWEPMVNQVPLTFVSEILRTLLNLMKEFLMKDHVMECLWFMFCKDVNQQATYNNLYGMLARVNSVGLKVLSEKELRHSDTFGEIFRAVTSWQPMQCDNMFPKCDGERALEIVNEVAQGSN